MNDRPLEPLVPDPEARALYVALAAQGGQFQPALLAERERPALERLRIAGLVVRHQRSRYWTVVNPRTAAARLSARLRAASAELLAKADALEPTLAQLTDAYDLAPPAVTGRTTIQRVDRLEQVEQRLLQLANDCEREILAAQPGGARENLSEDPAQPRELARDLAERGVAMRVIYQPGARIDPATRAYAAYATGRGTRIRILDEPYLRALVFDREVAVIAGAHDNDIASFIEDPVLVGLVVDQFERDWARAEWVRWEEPVRDTDGPLVELLARGLTQRAIATRLGLSERTVATQIARLRQVHDAETLFQLGWQLRAAEPPGPR
ncbi:helix-turn-helix domain-containing protein [Kitasatospora sp. NBC_01266]|uniref:helix-turn-helix domain-containing protein n=1 Tax=Kitasatospora sp. NBC_01266 TaxID=2903572 RepID=UPI002E315FDA|nr:helix-turn-helix domain-containing protein [Kitasatospora sp. NBC_01266]